GIHAEHTRPAVAWHAGSSGIGRCPDDAIDAPLDDHRAYSPLRIRDMASSSPHRGPGAHGPRPQRTSVPLALRTTVLRFRKSADKVHDLASFRASHLGPLLSSRPTQPGIPIFCHETRADRGNCPAASRSPVPMPK